MLQWFEVDWSSLFAQFCAIMYCVLWLVPCSVPYVTLWILLEAHDLCKYSFVSWVPRFSPYQFVIFFLLSSSSCHFTYFLPQHCGCIFKFLTISWYLFIVWSLDDIKCQGSSHGCEVDFISEGGKPGHSVQGAAVMVWWGSSPFFHGSQKDWFCINVSFIPDSWQGKLCISLSVCSFFGLSGPVQRHINERCSQIRDWALKHR